MLLSKAFEGFLLYARSGKYSPTYTPTIEGILKFMLAFFGDRELESLTLEDWQKYFYHLRYEHVPVRFNKDKSPLAESTIDNHWKLIRSFYNWATSLLSISRPDLKLPRPKYASPQIIPFTQEEVKRLLDSSQFTQVEKKDGRKYKIKRPNADRDKAILLILLDTGIRLGELCRLRLGDVNLENGEVYIRPYHDGRKSKSRTVFLGQRTRQAVWKFIAKQQASPDQSQPLINMKPSTIRIQVGRIGANAKVSHTHPHKFRHTFAITYLRNHGDIFTLQRLLGHATLEMTRRYLDISQIDLSDAHARASPVDTWRL